MSQIHNKAIFDSLGEDYETHSNVNYYQKIGNGIINFLYNFLNIKSEEMDINILDLCCGTGILTKQLSDTFKNARFLGVDISQIMLKEAQAKEIDRADFIQIDGRDLGTLNYQADLITCNYGIQWLNEDAFIGISKILKSKGYFICSIPGYTLQNVKVSKESVTFTGNKLFKAIIKISNKNCHYQEAKVPEKVMNVWNDTLGEKEIINAALQNNMELVHQEILIFQIDYKNAEDMIQSILSRGTFGDILSEKSDEFIYALTKYMTRMSEKYNNCTEENVTKYLIFKND
ncbi:MAG: class I SAM-dependent methyltransferase [Lachnospiraceae bacterium]|nr:class I SAM-dependent methyltransferase [Lachnospiraceae bacterium]